MLEQGEWATWGWALEPCTKRMGCIFLDIPSLWWVMGPKLNLCMTWCSDRALKDANLEIFGIDWM